MSSDDEGDGNDFLDDDFAAAEPEEVKPASKRALKKAKRLNAKVGDTSATSLYVRNLPFTLDNDGLEALFSDVGPVKSAFIVRDKDTKKSRGFGLVHFSIAADAEKAREDLNGKRVNGRSIAIDSARKRLPRELAENGEKSFKRKERSADGGEAGPAVEDETVDSIIAAAKAAKKPKSERRNNTDQSNDGRTIHVTGLAKDVTKQQIYKRFKKVAPIDLKLLIFPLPDCDEPTAQITYSTHKGARQAVEKLDTKTFKANKMEVVLKTSAKAKRKAAAREGTDVSTANQGKSAKKYRLILRNLPFTCTEAVLRKACVKYGKLDELNIIMDKETGKPRGFAFISYERPFDAAKALTGLNGKTLGGAEKWNARKVAVDWTVPKDEFQRVQAEEKKAGKQKAADSDDGSGSGSGSSDDDSDDSDGSGSDDSDSDDSDDGSDDDDSDEDDDDDDDQDDESESESDEEEEKSSDVDQGRTLFIRNVSFDTTEESLKECFAKFGEVTLSKLVREFESNRPRGTAFVQFALQAEAGKAMKRFNNAALEPLECDGRALQLSVAVDRRQANQMTRKNAKEREVETKVQKDTRNLKLLKVGAIMVNTKADEEMSSADRIKRQNLEMESKAKIKNPNYSVSKFRVSVHNLPLETNEAALKKMAQDAVKKVTGKRIKILQNKIVRASDRVGPDGKPRSRGFGFLQFEEHEDAYAVVKELNNNEHTFGPEKRPIVMFAWEDAQAIRKLQRRREQLAQRDARSQSKSDERKVDTFTKSGGKREASDSAAGGPKKKVKVRVRAWDRPGAKPKKGADVDGVTAANTAANAAGRKSGAGRGDKQRAAAVTEGKRERTAKAELTDAVKQRGITQLKFQKDQKKRKQAEAASSSTKPNRGGNNRVSQQQGQQQQQQQQSQQQSQQPSKAVAKAAAAADGGAKRGRGERAPQADAGKSFDTLVTKYMQKTQNAGTGSWFE